MKNIKQIILIERFVSNLQMLILKVFCEGLVVLVVLVVVLVVLGVVFLAPVAAVALPLLLPVLKYL